MTDAFTLLGVTPDADDEAIRKRYLQCIRESPPERDPERFAAIRQAYEKIGTLEQRTRYIMSDRMTEDTVESILEDPSCSKIQPRITLNQLLQLVTKPGVGS